MKVIISFNMLGPVAKSQLEELFGEIQIINQEAPSNLLTGLEFAKNESGLFILKATDTIDEGLSENWYHGLRALTIVAGFGNINVYRGSYTSGLRGCARQKEISHYKGPLEAFSIRESIQLFAPYLYKKEEILSLKN